MANERHPSRPSTDSLEVNLREMVKQRLQEERASEILESESSEDTPPEEAGATRGHGSVKVTPQVLAQYFRELSVLLQAGFPVLRALRIAGRGKTSPLMSAALTKVANQVENGSSLWRAMQSHPRVFPHLALSIVRAGEASGTLDEALIYLADSLEYEAEVRLKVRSAFDYPLFFGGLTLIVVAALIFLVLPRFQEVYHNLSHIKKVSSEGFEFLLALKAIFPWLMLLSAAVVILLWLIFRSRRFMILEKLKLRMPIFGKLLVYADLTRFAKTLAVQVKSSVPILDALRLSQLVVDNRELRQMVQEIRRSAEQGGQLSQPIKKYRVVPDTAVDMVEIGEESGSLDVSLEHLAKMMQTKMESTISRLTALLQPILLLVMGGVVVGVFVVMITPYFQVLDAVQSMGLRPMGSPAVNADRSPPKRAKKQPLRRRAKQQRRVLPREVTNRDKRTQTSPHTTKAPARRTAPTGRNAAPPPKRAAAKGSKSEGDTKVKVDQRVTPMPVPSR